MITKNHKDELEFFSEILPVESKSHSHNAKYIFVKKRPTVMMAIESTSTYMIKHLTSDTGACNRAEEKASSLVHVITRPNVSDT